MHAKYMKNNTKKKSNEKIMIIMSIWPPNERQNKNDRTLLNDLKWTISIIPLRLQLTSIKSMRNDLHMIASHVYKKKNGINNKNSNQERKINKFYHFIED